MSDKYYLKQSDIDKYLTLCNVDKNNFNIFVESGTFMGRQYFLCVNILKNFIQ